jgi:hypothetical protein
LAGRRKNRPNPRNAIFVFLVFFRREKKTLVVVRKSPPGGGPVCGVLKLGNPHGGEEEDVSGRRRRGERG